MRLVFAGTPAVAVPTLNALVASHHEVVAVLTRPDAPVGRGRRLAPSAVSARAHELGIPVLTPATVRSPEFVDTLTDLEPDCCPVVAYGALITPAALAVPPRGWVNLHFSLLPRWRGAAPVHHAIAAGDQRTGAVTFHLVPELDAGPIHDRLEMPIRAIDTAGDLLTRLAEAGAELMVRTLDRIASGTAAAQPQPADQVTYAAKVTVDDARIDWTQTVDEIDRRIRACTPDPGAWTTLGGERFKVHRARPAAAVDAPVGGIVTTRKQVHVACGSGSLELLEVQAHARKAMPAVDWARGVREVDTMVFDR